MDKTNFMEYHMVSRCLFLIGMTLFLWFCWPAVFKRMLNTGNVLGMLLCGMIMFYSARYQKMHQLFADLWQKKPMRVFFLLLAVFCLLAVILMIAASVAIIGAASNTIPQNTPAVVLGCAVKGKQPSRVLQERIDAAYDYMQKHPQAVSVLSGGKGRGEDISEAECMYQALQQTGIEDSRLYQEAHSVNTQENLENSVAVLKEMELTETVTVISSEFHLYRGRWWANKLGYESYGYAAHTDWKYLPTLFLREVIAVVHLWLTTFI